MSVSPAGNSIWVGAGVTVWPLIAIATVREERLAVLEPEDAALEDTELDDDGPEDAVVLVVMDEVMDEVVVELEVAADVVAADDVPLEHEAKAATATNPAAQAAVVRARGDAFRKGRTGIQRWVPGSSTSTS